MFTYSPLEKALEKQSKLNEGQRRKQVETLKVLKPEKSQQDLKSVEGLFLKEIRTNDIKNELDEITGWEEKIKRTNSKYEKSKHIYDFQQLKTIRSFAESSINDKTTVSEADEDQRNLLENVVEFNNKPRPKTEESKMKKK